MWRSERTRRSLRPNLFHDPSGRSWVGAIVGLVILFAGLALAGFYSNWFTSWVAANLPFQVGGILLVIIGVVVIVLG
ncbi:MAG: hypothetical protein WCB19_05725 [Thermoplasmata archaeon]